MKVVKPCSHEDVLLLAAIEVELLHRVELATCQLIELLTALGHLANLLQLSQSFLLPKENLLFLTYA